MHHVRRLSLVALSALLLTGCMFFEKPADRAIRHQPSYRAGYDDGCASANAQGANMRHGNVVRDDALYDTDKAYRVGWANGNSQCRRLAPPGQSEGALPDVNPGAGH
ncbi:MAG TPA: hypothetical protein VHE09_01650 [Rhizomicrobium sp.]|jgi:hypothetical protein|nr:hypothetical protein [Rhizomicrobium sp.]